MIGSFVYSNHKHCEKLTKNVKICNITKIINRKTYNYNEIC